ncbi:AraC family transcriptional regulator [Sphingobacterium lumbrici]|uniref:AraC family transcriptional regulator n=1 Tax=Sphingobacterium lumbrici TaxID=2559600 RepID=UPI00112765FA|nr:AraC family transcriptional regulator [Sphingobacterium lumbrici]
MESEAKLEGFDGEIRIVVPPLILKENGFNGLSNTFYITDIGYYPKAKNHYCKRPSGCDEHILIHCVDGRGIVVVDDEVLHLETNQYLLIPANTSHAYQADLNNPWTIYWMHFRGSQAQYIVQEIFNRVLDRKNVLAFDGEVRVIFEKFCRLLSKGYSREILEYISLSLPHFFSGYLYPEIFKGKHENSDDVIEKSIEFLKANIGNRIGLVEIVANIHLSVSHFSKLFKGRTGYSPIEYLNHLKVQKACYLLQFSDKRISLISFELGFEDQYYFSRLFKEHMGVSPSHYRNSLIPDNNKIHQ